MGRKGRPRGGLDWVAGCRGVSFHVYVRCPPPSQSDEDPNPAKVLNVAAVHGVGHPTNPGSQKHRETYLAGRGLAEQPVFQIGGCRR